MNNQPLNIYLFHCTNSLDTETIRRSLGEREKDHTFKTISLPCSGKLELIYLLKAFESGADGVALVTCKHGECRYLEGNLRAQKRAEAVRAILEEIGLDKERMKLIQQGDGGVQSLIDELDRFIERIRNATAESFESS
ncbi:MAG: hydrogenase iron-sulfur subunit [Deltaproteobacteria bacterium]|nr:hydrogenase iron-sulfur subunit [Deltaproteobacteria bacterium]